MHPLGIDLPARVMLRSVSASQNLIERARLAGLSPALAEALERELAPAPVTRARRVPGGWKGRVRIADDFDAPLPKEIEDGFYGDAGSDR